MNQTFGEKHPFAAQALSGLAGLVANATGQSVGESLGNAVQAQMTKPCKKGKCAVCKNPKRIARAEAVSGVVKGGVGVVTAVGSAYAAHQIANARTTEKNPPRNASPKKEMHGLLGSAGIMEPAQAMFGGAMPAAFPAPQSEIVVNSNAGGMVVVNSPSR